MTRQRMRASPTQRAEIKPSSIRREESRFVKHGFCRHGADRLNPPISVYFSGFRHREGAIGGALAGVGVEDLLPQPQAFRGRFHVFVL